MDGVFFNQQINQEMQTIYTKEFCSSIKKDKIISFVGTWTELEMIR